MESQDIGNHHFGVVALASVGYLLPQETILMQAGANQISSNHSKPEWQPMETRVIPMEHGGTTTIQVPLPPYGDDPRDAKWIQAGFKYYESH